MNKWTILPLVRHDKDPSFAIFIQVWSSMAHIGGLDLRGGWLKDLLTPKAGGVSLSCDQILVPLRPHFWQCQVAAFCSANGLTIFFVDTIEVANDDIWSLSLSYTITICVIIYYHRITIVICVNIYQQTRVEVQMIWGCDLLPGPSFAIAPRRRSWLCWHLSGRFPQRTEKDSEDQLIAPSHQDSKVVWNYVNHVSIIYFSLLFFLDAFLPYKNPLPGNPWLHPRRCCLKSRIPKWTTVSATSRDSAVSHWDIIDISLIYHWYIIDISLVSLIYHCCIILSLRSLTPGVTGPCALFLALSLATRSDAMGCFSRFSAWQPAPLNAQAGSKGHMTPWIAGFGALTWLIPCM